MTGRRERARRFFLAPSDGRALSALRIVIGAAMITEALRLYPYLDDLYGQYGFLQADLIEALTGQAIPGFLAKVGLTPAAHSLLLKAFYLAHVGLAFLFTVGFKTGPATVGLWATQTIILNSGYFSSYGVDRYFQNMLFLMIWLPSARHWSLDRLRAARPPEPEPACTLGRRLLQIFLLMTYADAGFSKMRGTDWWNGEAVWRVLNQPEFRRFDFLWLARFPRLCVLSSRATMFLEAFYGAGVWIPRLGTPWVAAIIAMHLSIALAMRLDLFGVTLAAINAALFLIPDGAGPPQNL